MRPVMRKKSLFALCVLQLWSCSSSQQSIAPYNSQVFSLKVQNALREVVPSIVGVAALFSYRQEIFNHQLRNGLFVPDSSSPTGYLLLPPDKKSNPRQQETQKVNGVGLVLYRDDRRAVVLTSAHILLKPDTISNYFRDKAGRIAQVLQSRSIKTSANFFAIGQSNQFLPAEILYSDAKLDLALLEVTASPTLGTVFPFEPAYEYELDWGDFAYVFGYPREVRQLTSGLVSKVANPGSFVLDVVARQGYSGGPVFVVHPQKGLQLVGMVRGVPVNKLSYIAPPAGLPSGQFLVQDEWQTSSAQEIDLIEYGTTYAIGVEVIGKFLKSGARLLERQGLVLDAKFFPR